MGFQPDGFNTGVWATPASHLFERFRYVDFFIIERFSARFFARHAQPIINAVNRNHALGA